jgi:hypothetical protein
MGSFSFQSSKIHRRLASSPPTKTTWPRPADPSTIGRVGGGIWYEHHVISGNYRLASFSATECRRSSQEQTKTVMTMEISRSLLSDLPASTCKLAA